jgi:uncharacterized protein YwqG
MFRTKDDICNDLIKAGIDTATADLLAQQAKPAVWLETHEVEDEAQIPIGATKIGGRPDLPEGVAWPMRPPWPDAEKRTKDLRKKVANPDKAWSWAKPEKRKEFCQNALDSIRRIESEQPLSFIAQINFAELWATGPLDADMPKQGILSIFYDIVEGAWGFNTQDRTGFVILFHDEVAKSWTRRDEPDELRNLPPDSRFAPLACSLHACITPLPPEEAQYDQLGLSEALMEQIWHDWRWSENGPQTKENGNDWQCHHIGGWPTPVQNGMQTECALTHAGHYCGTPDAYKDPALASIRATATDWLLLAQIGTDEKGDMSWGDNGQLYLWIRRDDLKARHFENAWLILQCY